jgi:hypothetical protein
VGKEDEAGEIPARHQAEQVPQERLLLRVPVRVREQLTASCERVSWKTRRHRRRHKHTHTHREREREVLVFNGDRVDSCTELERSLLEHDTVLVVHAGALREDLRRAGERTAQQRSVGDRESD